MSVRYLAVDIGAESGRGIVGTLTGDRLVLEEVHRFPNRPLRLSGRLHWNIYSLYAETVAAIGKAAAAGPLAGVGIDTWAVDYALLGPDDALLGLPYHYRDARTQGVMEAAWAVVPAQEIYAETGIQFLPFNTLYQLLAARRDAREQLASARALLMMGECLAYWLTGEKAGEFTNASTTQLLNPHRRTWSERLFEAFGLPIDIMPPVVPPGTVLGRLMAAVAEETGAGQIDVILPAVHDTGSAVAAVPGTGDDWCYLSSGTWSLLGVEVPEPVITPASFAHGFTNEGGVGGTFRLLKNVMGLWLLQECRRHWQVGGREYSYAELTHLAAEAAPFRTVIDPDDPRFLAPGDMPVRIRQFARETGQPEPETPGQFARCILESLALKYRWVIERLEDVTGRSVHVIHVVGGGVQNQVLNQFTADAAARPVVAGPVEATAAGNLLVQAMAHGRVDGLDDMRNLVRRSFSLREFTPRSSAAWEESYARFVSLLSKRAAGEYTG